MKFKELKADGLCREYNVTISAADFSAEVEKKLHSIAKNVSMAGFRAGKVPFAMVQKKYQTNAMSEALDDMVRNGVNELLKEKELRPVFTPDVELKEFKEIQNRADIIANPVAYGKIKILGDEKNDTEFR